MWLTSSTCLNSTDTTILIDMLQLRLHVQANLNFPDFLIKWNGSVLLSEIYFDGLNDLDALGHMSNNMKDQNPWALGIMWASR